MLFSIKAFLEGHEASPSICMVSEPYHLQKFINHFEKFKIDFEVFSTDGVRLNPCYFGWEGKYNYWFH